MFGKCGDLFTLALFLTFRSRYPHCPKPSWLTTEPLAMMTYGMIVQLPVSVAFGTDEEFDLRVQLESDLTRALAMARAGECVGGGIDTSHLNLQFDGITDPPV